MRRKHRQEKEYEPDLVYKDPLVTRFINYLMVDGKKTTAQKIMYSALEIIKENTKKDPLNVFKMAIENASPELELVTRRIGGANYQIPRPVAEYRKTTLASKWIIQFSRAKKGKPMAQKLAEELMAAYQNEGLAVKKKADTERMAEANKAFASLARRR